jgi:hypothetical protein
MISLLVIVFLPVNWTKPLRVVASLTASLVALDIALPTTILRGCWVIGKFLNWLSL